MRVLSGLLHQGDSIYQMMQVTGEEGKNLNYAARNSPEYAAYPAQIDKLVETLGRTPAATSEAQATVPGPN